MRYAAGTHSLQRSYKVYNYIGEMLRIIGKMSSQHKFSTLHTLNKNIEVRKWGNSEFTSLLHARSVNAFGSSRIRFEMVHINTEA